MQTARNFSFDNFVRLRALEAEEQPCKVNFLPLPQKKGQKQIQKRNQRKNGNNTKK